MLNDEIEKKYQLKKDKKKKLESTELTRQTHYTCYETDQTMYKENHNKL
jgi:hypothetical protein